MVAHSSGIYSTELFKTQIRKGWIMLHVDEIYMIESVEEERLFESYCTHEAGAYKILIGSPEKKRSL
jgi:hypothetical protein